MKVVWLSTANEAWLEIATYIHTTFGTKALLDYNQATDDWIDIIQENPCAFPVEPLLVERTKQYHSVVINHLTKLVYFVESETIYIADVWDARRNPETLKRGCL